MKTVCLTGFYATLKQDAKHAELFWFVTENNAWQLQVEEIMEAWENLQLFGSDNTKDVEMLNYSSLLSCLFDNHFMQIITYCNNSGVNFIIACRQHKINFVSLPWKLYNLWERVSFLCTTSVQNNFCSHKCLVSSCGLLWEIQAELHFDNAF
jgi:hypothetical protein